MPQGRLTSQPNHSEEISQELIAGLIERYDKPVPRYTSYPTALEFQVDFPKESFLSALKKMPPEKPVSLYFHIPFCENRCYYCGCNVIISRRKEMIGPFLDDLLEEVRFRLKEAGFRPKVSQLHFGGGTPNFLRPEDWQKLMPQIKELFDLQKDAEIAIELDPMMMDKSYLDVLKEVGINRVSFGIQDVTRATQEAVGRKQDMSHVDSLFTYAREIGIKSVNADFIYGLPYQTLKSYAANIEWIKQNRPDRIAVFSYAHIPWIKKHQENMPLDQIPDTKEKLLIYLEIRKALREAGYVEIGMDHYALPDDPLSQSLAEKSLHRNFMGYTTHAHTDMLAFGPSAISHVQGVYGQNHVKLRAWERSARDKEDLFEKGYAATDEDKQREEVIQSLMNNLYLDIESYNQRWGLMFNEFYADELERLGHFVEEGLVVVNPESIEVTSTGRHVVRHIASTFDVYRQKNAQNNQRFSKGI